jgi:hypothetical protein
MISVPRILQLHRETVSLWHAQEITDPYQGIWSLICQQHAFNFQLWHEEDIARSRNVSDARIASVKRNIDRFNQSRNDAIEKIDDWITGYLIETRTAAATDATMNTETPGSVIDRLSILALRMYHLQEQTERDDVEPPHVLSVQRKLERCGEQLDDLSAALAQLLEAIRTGRRRHRTYRQFKMYNDPALNPYLYSDRPTRRAG